MADPTPSPIGGLSILLVEDEYLIALDAAEMLSEMGASSVRVASNFDEAEACIKEGGFDIAILDVNLNGQLSVPLAEALQRQGTPLVFTTGYSLRHRPIPGLESCICVAKPYTGERLREGLASALKNHAAAG
ncbi:MAG: response regulator [Rhodospirillaceae bacterium]